jgi:hypothetical protein
MNQNDNAESGKAVRWSAWFGVMVEWVKWWGWQRWRIYCPKGDVSHLFERPDFQRSLFDYDEAFVSPCTLNEINCGGVRGKWTPKIMLIGITDDGRFENE